MTQSLQVKHKTKAPQTTVTLYIFIFQTNHSILYSAHSEPCKFPKHNPANVSVKTSLRNEGFLSIQTLKKREQEVLCSQETGTGGVDLYLQYNTGTLTEQSGSKHALY